VVFDFFKDDSLRGPLIAQMFQLVSEFVVDLLIFETIFDALGMGGLYGWNFALWTE